MSSVETDYVDIDKVGFYLTSQRIQETPLRRVLDADSCGGVCIFEGMVRNHNNAQPVDHLIYTSYDTLALTIGQQIVESVLSEYAIERAVCVHRIGRLDIGDMAIWVGVASAHRDAAFAGCRYILDAVKDQVPIWKQEFYLNDTSPKWLSNNG